MKNNVAIVVAWLFLLTSCAPVDLTSVPELEVTIPPNPSVTGTFSPTPELVFTPTLAPTGTPIPCDPALSDYCIVDGKFIFQNPLGQGSELRIARSYSYGSTDEGRRDPHRGVDIASTESTPVYAAGAGEVVFAGADDKTKFAAWKYYYGNVVVIQHAEGLYTLYGHLSKILVSSGAHVEEGDLIGAVGHTGVATGSHLHFEVRKGSDFTDQLSTCNPELWLVPEDGKGTVSITLNTSYKGKFPRPFQLTELIEGTGGIPKIYYLTSYAKGFDNNQEDVAMSGLAPGQYQIEYSDSIGLHNQVIRIEAGKLTLVVLDVK
ncbi:MAG: M23 family metallopeptidase [Chloroflexi bacterium]|nr:M23 family metallopeptidase [Chloroflexota bacterium]